MRRILLSALILAMCAPAALAAEGMWQPAQLPKIASDLKQHGLKLDQAALTDLTGYLMGAIVSLGGCTADHQKALTASNDSMLKLAAALLPELK